MEDCARKSGHGSVQPAGQTVSSLSDNQEEQQKEWMDEMNDNALMELCRGNETICNHIVRD